MTQPCDLTAYELSAKLRAGELTTAELTGSSLARIAQVDQEVNAFITVSDVDARAQAGEVDRSMARGDVLSPVGGIPLGVKDVFNTRGTTTTAGSRILEDYMPVYDATPWARLKEGLGVMVGKTNMDEFAMGSSNENSSYGAVRNPWNLETVPGGSSGGSAAAVAAGECVWALGSDTGGSVRQPASLCGVVGLKPTYGLISRYGLIAFASSLDHVGTFTRDVRDTATLLQAIAGHDPMDATSLDEPVPDYSDGLDAGVAGLKIGLLKGSLDAGVEPGVRDAMRDAMDRLTALGAEVAEVELPNAEYALSAYYLIAPSEASSNLARYDGVRYGYRAPNAPDSVSMMTETRGKGFGPEVKRRIMLGTYALSAGYYDAYYGQAQKVRTLVIRDYEAAFERFDVLASPTSPTTAFRLGERMDDPMAMYLSDVFTIPANFAGVPAISVPCGLDAAGLPVGLQLTTPVLQERRLLRAAYAFEQDFGFNDRPPILKELE